MPRVTSTRRSLCHSASGSRHGRSRKSGLPGRTSIWKRVGSLTLRWTLAVPGGVRRAMRVDERHRRLPHRSERITWETRMTPPPERSAIASSLPDDLRPLDRLARNLVWTWDGEIAAVLNEIDPAGLAAAAGNPVAMLAAAPAGSARGARGRPRLPRAHGARRIPPGGAPECAGLVRHAARCARRDRLLLARVRPQRGAAAVLGRPGNPGRRPPQGSQRPGRADRRHRALLPQRLLPAAAHGRRARRRSSSSTSTPRSCPSPPCSLRTARASRSACPCPAPRCMPCSGAWMSAVCRCCCWTPTCRTTRLPSALSPTASTAATASTVCGRRSCSASAASRRSSPAASSRPCST